MPLLQIRNHNSSTQNLGRLEKLSEWTTRCAKRIAAKNAESGRMLNRRTDSAARNKICFADCMP